MSIIVIPLAWPHRRPILFFVLMKNLSSSSDVLGVVRCCQFASTGAFPLCLFPGLGGLIGCIIQPKSVYSWAACLMCHVSCGRKSHPLKFKEVRFKKVNFVKQFESKNINNIIVLYFFGSIKALLGCLVKCVSRLSWCLLGVNLGRGVASPVLSLGIMRSLLIHAQLNESIGSFSWLPARRPRSNAALLA